MTWKHISDCLPEIEGERLKPCPFCGGDDLHVVASQSWAVKCHGCMAKVQCFDTRELAIKGWNKRI
jgi:Lar family restriction alleviation protein